MSHEINEKIQYAKGNIQVDKCKNISKITDKLSAYKNKKEKDI